jgi:AcrR family transcriptional regulator
MIERTTREKMIRSATVLMRERGVAGTSFSDVLAHSGAPRGSIYHHFPGGKAQLVEEATRFGGEFVAARFTAALEKSDPVGTLGALGEFWRGVLRTTDFAAGCPIAAATMGADQAPAARELAGDVFRNWTELYAELLKRAGLPDDRADSLATLVIAGIEGSILLTRAQRSPAALDHTIAELQQVVAAALGSGR